MIKQTNQMVEYLESNYFEEIYTNYRLRDINPKFLKDKRMEDLLRKYYTIDGSNRL